MFAREQDEHVYAIVGFVCDDKHKVACTLSAIYALKFFIFCIGEDRVE